MTESRSWSWRHAVLKSGLPATTRHVLLTISCFMNDVGGGCYPTQEQLAEASGLSDRAVRAHIDAAVKAGWLSRKEHGFRGQKWRNHEYEASWPTQDVEADDLHVEKGEERGSGPFVEGAEPASGKVRNDVPPILPDHQSSSSLRSEQPARAGFDEAWEVFPHRPMANQKAAQKAWAELSDDETHRCMTAIQRFARWHIEDSEARGVDPKAQLEFRPGMGKWISSGAWVDALHVTLKSDPAPPSPNGLIVLPPGHPDFEAVKRMRAARGGRVILGNSGNGTFRIEEVEQARAAS